MPRIVRDRHPRRKTTGFGVTDDELAELHTKAATAGYASVGAWIRDAIFGVEVTRPPARIDLDTNAQLRGIGANLNQALRRINSGQGNEADWDMIREASRAVIVLRRLLVGQDPGEPLPDRSAGVPGRVQAVDVAEPKAATPAGIWNVT